MSRLLYLFAIVLLVTVPTRAHATESGAEMLRRLTSECESGSGESCLRVGKYHEKREKQKPATNPWYAKARTIFQSECLDGREMASCTQLAYLLRYGEGGSSDPARANRLLTASCEGDDGQACYTLGMDAREGSRSKPAEPERAASLLEKASGLLRTACEGGDAQRCRTLSMYYSFHEKNEKKAFQYDLRACELGSADSCFDTAAAYSRGGGTVKDESKKIEFYARACDLGHRTSCGTLAMYYESGWGSLVQKDSLKADQLYEREKELW